MWAVDPMKRGQVLYAADGTRSSLNLRATRGVGKLLSTIMPLYEIGSSGELVLVIDPPYPSSASPSASIFSSRV